MSLAAEEVAANDIDGSQRFMNEIVDKLVDKLADTSDEAGDETKDSEETDETEDGDETEELTADDSMDKFTDMLMDKLTDKLFDFGLNDDAQDTAADDQLDDDELVEVQDYLRDEDELDEDELVDVLGLRGGAAMKAMKAMKAMAAMKAMKAMKIAKGKRAKSSVFRGTKEKTVGGLTKKDLIKNKYGKVVSKKSSEAAKKRYKNIKPWIEAVGKARKALGLKGFVAVKKGTPLYTKAKSLSR